MRTEVQQALTGAAAWSRSVLDRVSPRAWRLAAVLAAFSGALVGFIVVYPRVGLRTAAMLDVIPPVVVAVTCGMWAAVAATLAVSIGFAAAIWLLAADPAAELLAPAAVFGHASLLVFAAIIGGLRDTRERLHRAIARSERAQAALRASEERTLLASQAKSRFLANMSHEIRTPLSGIIGGADLLRDGELSAGQREEVELILGSARGLATLLNDILDFSKIEAKKLELVRAPLSPMAVVEETMQLLAPAAEAAGLDLACFVASEVPDAAEGDASRLRQVLINLVSNAIKFTEAGHVKVFVRREPAPAPALVLRFEVEDTGVGISAAGMGRLFTPFAQVESRRARHHGGTGLGLAIAKEICEAMGGQIAAQSTPGHGSRFWFTVSLAASPDSPAGERHAAIDPALEGRRVLLADPGPSTRALAAAQLRAWKCRVEVAASEGELRQRLTGDGAQGLDAAIIDVSLLADALHAVEQGEATLPPERLLGSTWAGRRRDVSLPERQVVLKPLTPRRLRRALAVALGTDLDAEEPSTPEASAPASAPSASTVRILLAEDDAVNRRVAQSILAKHGYVVDAVSDGLAAVKTLRRQTYDLVLMDVQMPTLDGLGATRTVRDPSAGARNPAIPIVALTAQAMPGDRDRCIAAGMDDYVSKPLEPEELLAAVARQLARRRRVKGDQRRLTVPVPLQR